MCPSCREVARVLGRPPVPVVPIGLVDAWSPLYRALRQYKCGEPWTARRQGARLRALLGAFAVRHLGCFGAPPDVTVVVPSGTGGRPRPHPLATVVTGAEGVPPLLDALDRGPVPIAHRRPAVGAYRAAHAVEGFRILLVDDVYTTGAHLQSAAVALLDAGARSVDALVVGRYVRSAPGRPAAACDGSAAPACRVTVGRWWCPERCARCAEGEA